MPYIGENGQLAYSTYTEQFDYLWRVLSTGYVFWDVDTTDWDAMYERYLPAFQELDEKYERQGFRADGGIADPLYRLGERSGRSSSDLQGQESSSSSR